VYGVLGDCPALKSALCHIGHTGYWPCWYCEVKGKHVAKKRQYYYNENFVIRTPSSFLADSRLAASTKGGNVKGRLGVSAFHHILDIPLPGSCIADYLHVTLLRHGCTVFTQTVQSTFKAFSANAIRSTVVATALPSFLQPKSSEHHGTLLEVSCIQCRSFQGDQHIEDLNSGDQRERQKRRQVMISTRCHLPKI
jgi:hypothetical protein